MLKKISSYSVLIITSLVSIIPFLWIIIASTNKSVDVTAGKLTLGSHFMENFNYLLENTMIVDAFKNSLIIAVVTTILALIFASSAGYAFVMYKDKIKERIFNILLLSMMIPFMATLIPLYKLFGQAQLLNTYSAIIIPAISTAFLIFFFKQNAIAFPKELLEAGRIDGVSEYGLFFKIFVPTMKSTYAAAAIIIFMSSWNNYLWPLVALQDNAKKTLPLIISNLNSSYSPDYGVIMLAVLISIIPTGIVFFTMQKSFVQGILGSVK